MNQTAREIAAEIMRFVRGSQGMTHDERAWFMERIEPICAKALIRAEEAEAEVKRLNEILNRVCDAAVSDPEARA